MYVDYFVQEKGNKCKNDVLGGVFDFVCFFNIFVMLFGMFIQFFYKFFVVGLVELIDCLADNQECNYFDYVNVL